MPARQHHHRFTALWWHFGPYGRQDVHVHSCPDWPRDVECDRVLIGVGRNCGGKPDDHHRETLGEPVPRQHETASI